MNRNIHNAFEKKDFFCVKIFLICIFSYSFSVRKDGSYISTHTFAFKALQNDEITISIFVGTNEAFYNKSIISSEQPAKHFIYDTSIHLKIRLLILHTAFKLVNSFLCIFLNPLRSMFFVSYKCTKRLR